MSILIATLPLNFGKTYLVASAQGEADKMPNSMAMEEYIVLSHKSPALAPPKLRNAKDRV